MKLVFFGEDSFSAIVLDALIEDGQQVSMVVTPYYENFLYKRLELTAQKKGIPFSREKDIHSANLLNRLKAHRPDLLITAHFEKLLKKELIELPELGCLNLHPSLLPAYRGMSPQHWPIINGDAETGVTVHYIEEGIDTGNILVQKKLPIRPGVYVADLQKDMLPIYRTIMVDAIKKIASGDAAGVKQDPANGSLYGRFKLSHAQITVESTVTYAYNLVRAVSKPYMGARFREYILWKAHPAKATEEMELLGHCTDIGIHFEQKKRAYLRLRDGILIIDSYERIAYERKDH